MIQATDFVCPVCAAQVGKPCTDRERVFNYGNWAVKPVHRFGKPHGERRRLAKEKRTREAA